MKRKDVLIEADSLASHQRSGVGRVCLELVRQLDSLAADPNIGIRVTLIISPQGREEVTRLGFKNVKVRSFPYGYKYFNAILTRLPVPLPVDLLFGRGVYIFPSFKNWWVPFSRSVTWIHDAAFVVHPETIEPRNYNYLKSNIKRWLKRTDRVITDSDSSKRELQAAFPTHKDKIYRIYNGVNRAEFYPRPSEEVTRIVKSLKLPSNYFMYVGNLEPRKNLTVLLEAYEIYCRSLSPKKATPLVIISGDGWSNDLILKKIADMKGRGMQVIRPERYVEDAELPALLSGAIALVHVPIHEGFGMTPLEALSCGCRVLVSDIPVLREVLSPAVEGVRFVDPTKTEAIANGLAELSGTNDYPRDTVKLLKRYSWRNTVLDIIKIIDKIDK